MYKINMANCKELYKQSELFEPQAVCADHYPAYNRIIPKEVHVQTKSETWSVEGLNSRIRHYLAEIHTQNIQVHPYGKNNLNHLFYA